MTAEEAIKELREASDSEVRYGDINHHYDEVIKRVEAYDMAIKALEQEPILDKIRAEIIDTLYVDSLIFGELIDFLNGKISADDVIEEFNQVTRIEVLQIIDKYKAESGGKE